MARAKVVVVHETRTGLNDKLKINGINYTNTQAYKLAKAGKVEGHNGSVTSKGTKYIRSNPDRSKNNNIEK